MKICRAGPVLSSSGTGTRLYINGLCVTVIVEKVTNLQGFISLEEIKLFSLMRNTNFISVGNPYISLLRIYITYDVMCSGGRVLFMMFVDFATFHVASIHTWPYWIAVQARVHYKRITAQRYGPFVMTATLCL